MNVKNIAAATSMIAAVVFGAPASANNSTSFNAMGCEAAGYSQYTSSAELYWSDSALYNLGNGSARGVVCPVDAHNFTNTQGLNWLTVNVYRHSNAGTMPFWCTIRSYSAYNGQLLKSYTAQTKTVGDTSIYLYMDKSAWGGYYSMSCYIPAGSRLKNYWVSEKGDDV